MTNTKTTVAELIEKLKEFPQDMTVVVNSNEWSSFYSPDCVKIGKVCLMSDEYTYVSAFAHEEDCFDVVRIE